ncbi:MAG: NINE protein [Mycobacteriaceae bacterium]|uniref:NINE protein n=1 Tax=Corynebacterium variabile TaxID=1727 RepID=UPI002592CDDA|nr:NINE protein [uncultured Corynebacterium sp.]
MGGFGAHNFYLGYRTKAWWQLGLTIVGILTAVFLIGFLFTFATGIWGFIEFIMILAGGEAYTHDAQGRPLS